MDKYSRYYGVIVFFVIVSLALFVGYKVVVPAVTNIFEIRQTLETKERDYNKKLEQKRNVERRLAQIKNSIATAQKKVYSPVDSDLGNDTLFFTLYKDVIEMIHSNSIKIKSMEYAYNPESDSFVKFGNDVYFVCEINMELVSNYTNLGKFIQDVVQYPYYIKINNISVRPYQKDKKILISDVSLRLYAHTAPEDEVQ